VNVSPELAVIKQISSLVVSGSIAIVNWSTLPAARVTPPSSAEPVPVDTAIEFCELLMLAERIVSTEIEEYRRVIVFPYLL
jgi:hypothetical protein